ncbi:MAG: hypothetical protein C0404_11880 [Verrucomicrobia bacterium]|nr:hypothetical protein [Verrucomicrobiota bacterium]
MTIPADEPILIRRLVLFFDFCSSTSILEDLLRTENQRKWRDLIISMKVMLKNEKDTANFDIYKFVGDGWILLFPEDFPLDKLFSLLKRICSKYETLYRNKIAPFLSTDIGTVGVTFGLDKGTLIRVVLNNQAEYLGRPLNVAARLQGSIKDRDASPQGKVLMSRPVAAAIKAKTRTSYRTTEVERKLRNIAGGERYKALKLNLFGKPRT